MATIIQSEVQVDHIYRVILFPFSLAYKEETSLHLSLLINPIQKT